MEKIKIDKQQRKNLFAAIKNFHDIIFNYYQIGLFHEEQEVLAAYYVIWDFEHDYGMFCKNLKEENCLTNIKLSLETVFNSCKKSGFFQNLIPSLEDAKRTCLDVLDNKLGDIKIEINDKEWVKNKKRSNCFMFLICIFAFVMSSIFCIVMVNEFQRYKTEEVSIVFTIQNVNLVQYSNSNYLTAYTYLRAPNGRELSVKETSSSRKLYEVAKNHIGQDIELLVKEKYYLNKNGEKENIEHKIKFPIQILKIEGEDVEYVENISNVEVQRRFVVVPYLK